MAKKTAVKKAVIKAACVNCGALIPEGAGIVKDGINYCGDCAGKQPEKETFFAPRGFMRIICYLLCLNPVLGFLLGAIYYWQHGTDNRVFARKCFIFMAIGLFIGFIFLVLFIIAGALSGGMDGGSGFQESYY